MNLLKLAKLTKGNATITRATTAAESTHARQSVAKVFLKAFDGNYTISILLIAFQTHTVKTFIKYT